MTPSAYIFLGIILTLTMLWITRYFIGFASQKPSQYALMTPEFDLPHHLNGPMICEGVVYGPFGGVSARFTANMHGHWEGTKGTLTEDFTYDSGTIQNREWHLMLGTGDGFTATAPDVIGVGRGTKRGAAVQLKYKIRLPETAGGYILDATDWMYVLENGTIVNRSQLRKFGIKMAELVATIRKVN